MRKSRKKFRTGQQVRSVYDSQRKFRIDKSIQPERLFHEKGSDRWYTRSELLALGEANEPATRVGAKALASIGRTRSLAFRGISGKQLAEPGPAKQPEKRNCLECEAEFTPRRKRQKFCCDAHRTAYWKRQGRLQTEAGAVQACAATGMQ
jgi:hypothetical protein